MEARKTVMTFLARSQEAFAPIQMIMQSLTLTLVAYDFIAWRGLHPYVAVPLIFVLMISIILGWGYIFVEKLGLFRAKRTGMIQMDPIQVYAFNPFQEMMGLAWQAPMMEAAIEAAEAGGRDMTEARGRLEQLQKWLELGYIPKEDFPEHLRKYYRLPQGHRI